MRINKADIPLDNEIPFNFFNNYPVRKQYDNDGDPGYHWHESFEIAHIVKGGGKCLFKDREFVMRAGDIIVVNNIKPHFFDVEEDMYLQIISFVPSLIWSGSAIDSEYLHPFLSDDSYYFSKVQEGDLYYDEILKNICLISDEFSKRMKGYKMAIKAHLQIMLTYLIRNIDSQTLPSKAPGHKNWLEDIEQVQTYVKNNYQREITLTCAANMVHLTTQYFSTMFKKATGMSFVEYINQYRVHQAMKLLCESDYKIIEIASQCGFNNVTHFNRVFKQRTGKSPSNFINNK